LRKIASGEIEELARPRIGQADVERDFSQEGPGR